MKHDLRDLIDIEKLQELTDELYKATGIPSSLITTDGEILTGSGWQRICTDFHRRHPQIEKECIKSDTTLHERMAGGEPFAIYRCPRGLVDACSPLVIDGEHLANIFCGQVLTEEPDASTEQFFRAQARKFGLDEEEYIAAFREVPVFPPDRFQGALSFLATLSQSIADMGLARKRELEANETLRATELQFRRRIESLSLVPWEFDLATDRYTYMGHQAETVLGRPARHWQTVRDWSDVIHEDDKELVVHFSEKEARAGRDYTIEYRIYTPDGGVRWINDVVSVISGPSGPERLIGYKSDITEQKQTEAQLRAATADMARLLEESSRLIGDEDAVWRVFHVAAIAFLALAQRCLY